MGEEVQKPAEEKKPEEAKKPEEEKKLEEPPSEKPSGGGGDDKKEEPKAAAADESKDPPPPPPPQEIVLRVFMHCEGCARKVRRCLKGFEGVEDVQTDCKTHKVVVKGEKADPLKVLERVQKKSHRQVELLSPLPKPPAEDPKKEEVKEETKPEEKKEPQVITVVLKVHMHCEACAQEIRKRILRMKGVESADPDLKSSQVTVKGAFEAANLVEYVYKRTGKHAVIVKQEPPPPEKKEEEDKGKDGKVEKKGEEGGGDKKDEKKEEGGEAKPSEGGGGGGDDGAAKPAAEQEDVKVVELRKNEFYYYYPQNYQAHPARFAAESSYAYPPAPQMFSDENPNACSVM